MKNNAATENTSAVNNTTTNANEGTTMENIFAGLDLDSEAVAKARAARAEVSRFEAMCQKRLEELKALAAEADKAAEGADSTKRERAEKIAQTMLDLGLDPKSVRAALEAQFGALKSAGVRKALSAPRQAVLVPDKAPSHKVPAEQVEAVYAAIANAAGGLKIAQLRDQFAFIKDELPDVVRALAANKRLNMNGATRARTYTVAQATVEAPANEPASESE